MSTKHNLRNKKTRFIHHKLMSHSSFIFCSGATDELLDSLIWFKTQHTYPCNSLSTLLTNCLAPLLRWFWSVFSYLLKYCNSKYSSTMSSCYRSIMPSLSVTNKSLCTLKQQHKSCFAHQIIYEFSSYQTVATVLWIFRRHDVPIPHTAHNVPMQTLHNIIMSSDIHAKDMTFSQPQHLPYGILRTQHLLSLLTHVRPFLLHHHNVPMDTLHVVLVE